MILVVAGSDDTLARAVVVRLACDGTPATWLDEATLPEAPLEVRGTGGPGAGVMEAAGVMIPLESVRSVLLRPRLPWAARSPVATDPPSAPPRSLGTACWATFAALSCRILNRWPLEFWLQDPDWPETLATSFTTAAGLSRASLDHPAERRAELTVVGSEVLAESGNGLAEWAIHWMGGRRDEIARWQARTGVVLSRVTITAAAGGDPTVAGLDPFPQAPAGSECLELARSVGRWLQSSS